MRGTSQPEAAGRMERCATATCVRSGSCRNKPGVATIQFEAFGQPVSSVASFLHLDLMPDNTVRIDDVEGTKFGTFPRDQPFIVQVTLNINPSSSTAHVVLSGAGASGTADRTVPPPFQGMALQFGAVRLWMGFPHLGKFDATNIVVKLKED